MARIRGQNTAPELLVRGALHRLGYRYRLHARGLPGKPDIAFPRRRKAIFVHGCFWHQHRDCRIAHLPDSRQEYWADKFKRTVERDTENLKRIEALGWKAMIVWECQIRDTMVIEEQLARFLGAPKFDLK